MRTDFKSDSCRQVSRAPRELRSGFSCLGLCCLGFCSLLAGACGVEGSSDPSGGGEGNTDGSGGTGGDGDGDLGTGGVPGSGGASDESGGTGGLPAGGAAFPEPSRIATDGSLTCALVGSTARCWGTDNLGMPATVPDLQNVTMVSGGAAIAALDTTGVAYVLTGVAPPFSWGPLLSDAPVHHVKYSFIFLEDGTAQWMARDGELESPFAEPLVDAATNVITECGIRAGDQTMVCRPPFQDMSCGHPATVYAAPSGTFSMITAAFYHLCALATDETLTCWGAGTTPITEPEEPGCQASDLALNQGQDAPPSGTFLHVSAGTLHNCGVRTDGTIACWGAGTTDDACGSADLDCGQAMPPPDADFVQVAAGFTHSCGLKATGKVVCWGSDTGGKSTPPPDLQP